MDVDDWRDDNITWIKKMDKNDTWNRKLVFVKKELITYLARVIIKSCIDVNKDNAMKDVEIIYGDLHNSSLDKLIKTASDHNIDINNIIERYRFFR